MTDLEICKDIARESEQLARKCSSGQCDTAWAIGSILASIATLAEIVKRQLQATDAGH